MDTVLDANTNCAAAPSATPLPSYTLPVQASPPVLIESRDDLEPELKRLVEIADTNLRSGKGCTILGLDTEWIEDNKVALLQLATHDSRCVLVRADCITKETST